MHSRSASYMTLVHVAKKKKRYKVLNAFLLYTGTCIYSISCYTVIYTVDMYIYHAQCHARND